MLALVLVAVAIGGAALATRGAPKATTTTATTTTKTATSNRARSSTSGAVFANVTAGDLQAVAPTTALQIQAYIRDGEYKLASGLLGAIPFVGALLVQLLALDIAAGTAQQQAAMAKLEAQLPGRLAQAKAQLAHGDTASTTAAIQKSIPKSSTSGTTASTAAYRTAERRQTAQAEQTGNVNSSGVLARPTINTRNLQLLE